MLGIGYLYFPYHSMRCSVFPSVGVGGLDGRHQAPMDGFTASHGREYNTKSS